jgi:hypothetical protein
MAYVATAAAVLAIVGGVVQGVGQKQQAEAQAEAVEKEGRQQLRDAYAEERAIRRRRALVQGEARSAIGRSGVQIEGSPLDFLAQNAAEIEVEALSVRTYGINAQRQARAVASGLRNEGRTALYAGILGGVSSGLSAYASAGGTFRTQGPRPGAATRAGVSGFSLPQSLSYSRSPTYRVP